QQAFTCRGSILACPMSPCSNGRWQRERGSKLKEKAVRYVRIICLTALVISVATTAPEQSFAQNFGSDARMIGLGGNGGSDNIASKLMEDQEPYRAIPLPFGLFQVLNNKKFF